MSRWPLGKLSLPTCLVVTEADTSTALRHGIYAMLRAEQHKKNIGGRGHLPR